MFGSRVRGEHLNEAEASLHIEFSKRFIEQQISYLLEVNIALQKAGNEQVDAGDLSIIEQ